MKKLALLIGVGEHQYADCLTNLSSPAKDVESLRHVLSEPQWGNFDRVDCLLNPDRYDMEHQVNQFFQNCDTEDQLLLYFSGHGLQDHLGNLHLATRITHKSEAGELIRSSTLSAHAVGEQIRQSPSKYQVLLLDCCFSGAFDPALQPKYAGDINLKGLSGSEGCAVLASSGANQYSFEHKDQDLSLYTRYLVEGITTGAADRRQVGQIELAELHNYASQQIHQHWPGINPQMMAVQAPVQHLVIAQTQPPKTDSLQALESINSHHLKLASNKRGLDGSYDRDFPPLPNPSAMYEGLIQRLIEHLPIDPSLLQLDEAVFAAHPDWRDYRLKALCAASHACFAAVWQMNLQEEWQVAAQHDDQAAPYLTWLTDLLPQIAYDEIFSGYGTGVMHRMGDHLFVFIPIDDTATAEFLVIGLPQSEQHLIQEPYGVIVAAFYQLSRAFVAQPDRAEAALIDHLRQRFGFVSPQLYDRRFQLFRDRLHKMVVYFQPIIQLQPIKIIAWEALARNPDDQWSTPVDLFNTAELWGAQFTTDLDLYFLQVATESYRDEHTLLNLKRSDDAIPLAVNVYPHSLLKAAYFNAVKDVFDRGVVEPGNLILEISEKAALPKAPAWRKHEPDWMNFRECLKDYHRKHLKVRFAIDDFGVGYASMSRLLGLQLDYIKIDQEVLHHAKAVSGKALQFVHDVLIESNHCGSTIIVEGVDENCSVSLSELKSFGVSSIQGFLVDKALAHIYRRLSSTQYEMLTSRLKIPIGVG